MAAVNELYNIPYAEKVKYLRELYTDTSIATELGTTITLVRANLPHPSFEKNIDAKYADAFTRYEEHMMVPLKERVWAMLDALNKEYKPTHLGRALAVSDTTIKRILKRESARITFPFFLSVEKLYHTALQDKNNQVSYIPHVSDNIDNNLLVKMRPKRNMNAIMEHPDYEYYGAAARELFKAHVENLHKEQSISSIAREIGVSNSYFREALYGDFSDDKMNVMYNILLINHK